MSKGKSRPRFSPDPRQPRHEIHSANQLGPGFFGHGLISIVETRPVEPLVVDESGEGDRGFSVGRAYRLGPRSNRLQPLPGFVPEPEFAIVLRLLTGSLKSLWWCYQTPHPNPPSQGGGDQKSPKSACV
jgi:hypothetical protein